MKIYSLCDISIGYEREKKVVGNNLCAEMNQGEMVCLIGPNGTGKSTLLRTLAGFQPALKGEILLREKPLSEYTAQQLSREVSIVLTDNSHIRNLSVFDVVSMGRSPYTGFWGRLGEEDKEKVEESMKMTGVTNLRERMIHTLSDGERQKVMIAKALAQDTPVILLDEPTSFLYYRDKVSMMLLLQRLAHEEDKSVLLSTHEIDLALEIADRIWYLDEGELISGTPKELCNNKINDLSYEKINDCLDAISKHRSLRTAD